MILRRFLAGLALLLAGIGPAAAHEVRPAYLQIVVREDGRADVLWKQPAQGELAVALRPRLDRLLERQPDFARADSGFALAQWRDLDLGERGLAGRTIAIGGLDRTITDVLLVVKRRPGGETLQHVLTPAESRFTIAARDVVAVPAYLRLGFEHILAGVDHLLFVLGLVLLSRSISVLLRTITAFTVAHSITLALTALGWMNLTPSLVEALVALSILFLAIELVRKSRGEEGLTLRYPWLIAFGFGLLHGAAFAGALAEIGLPESNIPGALLLFNVGVELGQVLFVIAVTAVLTAARRLSLPAATPARARSVATYSIGVFASFWFFERLHTAFAQTA